MKRKITLLVLLCLLLVGCGGADEYRVSTVVYIPDSPTEVTQLPEESTIPEPETQAGTEAVTEPEETETVPETSEPEKKPSSGKSSKKKKPNKKETEPPATEPPATEPPATEPPATEPPATEPPATEPPATEPPATEPPATEPPATEPPATEPPATEPPAMEPPVTEPPATEPPTTEPPVTEPAPTEPPLYDISGYSVGGLEKAIKNAMNTYRTEEGLAELSLSNRLCAIASCRGYEVSQVWSHTRPDGRSFGSVLRDYGYGAGTVKELLVYVSGSGDGQSIVDKWMESDAHKDLLLGNFSKVGIGIYRANGYTYIACLLVG